MRARRGEVRVTHFTASGQEFAVLSLPLEEAQAPAALSEAEQHVFRAIVDGLTDDQIADRRGTSPRTVANRVASVFRKLGVGSRSELRAQFSLPH